MWWRLNGVLGLSLAAVICLKLPEAGVDGVDYNHFSSYYDVQCQDCGQGGSYYYCHTRDGWDYCSPASNRDYYGRPCKADHPCGRHGYSYSWCNTQDGSWGYCGRVEMKVVTHLTSMYKSQTNSICQDECGREGDTDYFWCHTLSGWDYCSPLSGVTYKNILCNADHPCSTYGYNYYWCYSGGSWDYCGPLRDSECRLEPEGRQLMVNQFNEIVCEKVDRGNKVQTQFQAEPTTDLADGGYSYDEVAYQVVALWDNGCLQTQPTSSIIRTPNLRLDLQGFVNSGGIRYYNYQIQINGHRRPGQRTSIAQVLFPVEECVPERYIRRAFMESLVRRARIRVTVTRYCLIRNEYRWHEDSQSEEKLSLCDDIHSFGSFQNLSEMHSQSISS
ncbi:hypothetical protein NDU88_004909 [Pleurodeles waltl]|uniref:Uncharacterized protein n=1 Tax=Pleurodeles waltl TaxID=8319 RepID=A0AAV7V4V3_PLEWA|nr:hypothetical protein NDU88_004909 [Pleurodeles waltl]